MKIQSQKATNIQIKLKEITGECIVQCAPNQTWISQIGWAELNSDADTCCNCWRDSESLIIISILDGVVTCLPTHSFMKIAISYFKIIILGRVFLRKSKNTCDRWCVRCNHVDLIYSSTATTTGTDGVFLSRPSVCVSFWKMVNVPFAINGTYFSLYGKCCGSFIVDAAHAKNWCQWNGK